MITNKSQVAATLLYTAAFAGITHDSGPVSKKHRPRLGGEARRHTVIPKNTNPKCKKCRSRKFTVTGHCVTCGKCLNYD